MELHSITARRRLATVAAHFPNDPVSTASLVPLNCSSSLNSVIRRCDSKLPFARQASSEQGFFMRQASTDEGLFGLRDQIVEVDNLNLIVTGRRTSVGQKVDAGTKGSICGYQKQEILQGPFKVSWPLPINVNKDNVSAEFMDGLLRIVIPKL
ncbi:BnaA08g28630D [Brassica napus]|uniref:BnaA08g28630D protein n=1 Tax=Brassica napus TaxID=3708 RepID=A0A078FRS9_BRANA|nr:BnaA08g28630D [Brassica napus]